MKKEFCRKDYIMRLSVVTIFIIGFFIVVSRNVKVYTNITYDVSSNRFLKTMHLVSKEVFNNIKPKQVTTIEEIELYGSTNHVTYNGNIGGYGYNKDYPTTTCLSNFNKGNGNNFYKDYQFGYSRVIESDSKIPCGTVIKISNFNNYSDFYAIVLDHSSINLGTTSNLLFESEEVSSSFSTTKVTYTIVRWGW